MVSQKERNKATKKYLCVFDQLKISWDSSVSHPEEIGAHRFQLGGLGGAVSAASGYKAEPWWVAQRIQDYIMITLTLS